MSSLLPHSGNMVLLDAICHFDDDSLTAETTVKPSPYSLPDDSWPVWIGLELMAQAVGAWAGCQARKANKPIQLGFLLGTRHYENHSGRLLPGARLKILAKRSLLDPSGMGTFECKLHDGTRLLAQARLKIYQPEDSSTLLDKS
ncbi:ApeP family dehydratase [Cephaloticoccus primus]|uniref:ApeP family dehydratase n=1 Tax=Cephaloticoccus primus TaxID=1548207 RepID=UPI0018D34B9C|nr:hotdog family protein [Cephaloticoccus primus]